jgi:hypothetical protein
MAGWPLAENLPYQFVEDEYMLADEYDELLSNPGDFVVRKMMPRMSQTLEPLAYVTPATLAIQWLHPLYAWCHVCRHPAYCRNVAKTGSE